MIIVILLVEVTSWGMLEPKLLGYVDFTSNQFFWAPCIIIKYGSLSLVTDLGRQETVLLWLTKTGSLQ